MLKSLDLATLQDEGGGMKGLYLWSSFMRVGGGLHVLLYIRRLVRMLQQWLFYHS